MSDSLARQLFRLGRALVRPPSARVTPTPSSPPPTPEPSVQAVEGITAANLAELLAALRPQGRPLLIHHWASWDDTSVAALPALVALHAQTSGVDWISVGWDRFMDAPMPRIAMMADRPSRWAHGEQLLAHRQTCGATWPCLLYTGTPEALFDALDLPFQVVPQYILMGPDGQRRAAHVGPCAGPSWEALARALHDATLR